MQSIKLLIVEDDITSQLMLKTILADYTLTIVGSGEEGLETVQTATGSGEVFDMVVLDINLPGIDGYEVCQQLRTMGQYKEVPIIFLSSYTDLEDRLKAYGVGGNDYVSKPFDVKELKTKVGMYSSAITQSQEANQVLADSHGLLMNVQTASAKLQAISRFIQVTLFCHDMETLLTHFFKTAKEIGVEGVLQYRSVSGDGYQASDGEVTVLEQEILEMSSAMDRIHMFGQDRAIFRWTHGTFLTRKVGEMIDTLAIFMDALEAGIKAIDAEYVLLHRVSELEVENEAVRAKISELFKLMSTELKAAIMAIGMVTEMDYEDEDRLNDVMDDFGNRIDDQLVTMAENNAVMNTLIEELKVPPPELQGLLDSALETDDGIELF